MPGTWKYPVPAAPALYAKLSNNNIDTVFPRIIARGDDYFFPQKEVDYLRGRLFQISLTRGRALNILFHYSIKPKIDKKNIGFLSVQIWLLINFQPPTPCCMLLDVVACCCANFETGQTFSYVQTGATTPNNVGSCWPTVLHLFARGFTNQFCWIRLHCNLTGRG